jgi:hypothetical protein
MTLLREVLEGTPAIPDGGWNVGHLANLGLLLSCENFSIRIDLANLNALFDIVESGEIGEIRDHDARIVEVDPTNGSVVLTVRGDTDFPNGLVLDPDTLKEMGIEQYEETASDDPTSEFDSLSDDDTVQPDVQQNQYDPLDGDPNVVAEALKLRRVKKTKRGFKVTGRRDETIDTTAAYKKIEPKIKMSRLEPEKRKKT